VGQEPPLGTIPALPASLGSSPPSIEDAPLEDGTGALESVLASVEEPPAFEPAPEPHAPANTASESATIAVRGFLIRRLFYSAHVSSPTEPLAPADQLQLGESPLVLF
jgi:hypothetical protein